jgi:hypothetical protein
MLLENLEVATVYHTYDIMKHSVVIIFCTKDHQLPQV